MAVFQYNHIGVLTIMNQSSKCSTTRRLALQILCTFAAAATVSCKAQNQNTGGLKDYNSAEAERQECRRQAISSFEAAGRLCKVEAPRSHTGVPVIGDEYSDRMKQFYLCENRARSEFNRAKEACDRIAEMTDQESGASVHPSEAAWPQGPGGYIENQAPEAAGNSDSEQEEEYGF